MADRIEVGKERETDWWHWRVVECRGEASSLTKKWMKEITPFFPLLLPFLFWFFSPFVTSRPGSAQGTCDPLQRARVLLNKSNIQTEFSDVPMHEEKCEKGEYGARMLRCAIREWRTTSMCMTVCIIIDCLREWCKERLRPWIVV